MLVFIAINQVDEPLLGATVGEELWYWLVRLAALAGGLWAADLVVAKALAERLVNPRWLKPVVLVSALGLLPFAAAEVIVEPLLPIRPEYTDDELRAYSIVLVFLGEYVTILSILIPVHLLLWLLIEWKAAAPGAELDEPAGPLPEFLERASVRQFDDVLALQAEEHYVRIYRRDGAELIHHRFGDAVDAMPEALGLKVHRSWWVSDSAVLSAKRGSRRWQLILPSDIAVPVSDSYVKAVRERGWLKRKRSK